MATYQESVSLICSTTQVGAGNQDRLRHLDLSSPLDLMILLLSVYFLLEGCFPSPTRLAVATHPFQLCSVSVAFALLLCPEVTFHFYLLLMCPCFSLWFWGIQMISLPNKVGGRGCRRVTCGKGKGVISKRRFRGRSCSEATELYQCPGSLWVGAWARRAKAMGAQMPAAMHHWQWGLAMPWVMLLLLGGSQILVTHSWHSQNVTDCNEGYVILNYIPATMEYALHTFNLQRKDTKAYRLVCILNSWRKQVGTTSSYLITCTCYEVKVGGGES